MELNDPDDRAAFKLEMVHYLSKRFYASKATPVREIYEKWYELDNEEIDTLLEEMAEDDDCPLYYSDGSILERLSSQRSVEITNKEEADDYIERIKDNTWPYD